MSMMQIKKKVYIPVFFCCEGLSVYLQKKKKEGVGRISSNLGKKKGKIYMAGKLFAHNVWCESTQIEYTSQKMAQTKTQLLFKLFAYQDQSHCITDL